MIVLVVAFPAAYRGGHGKRSSRWDRWCLQEAMSVPVRSSIIDGFADLYGMLPEKAVALLPPGCLEDWDPALAAQTADDLLDWAEEEGNALILRGHHVAAAFGIDSDRYGETLELTPLVRAVAVPARTENPQPYAAALQGLLED